MAFVLLERRSFTATVPLPQNSDDKMLLETILRSFHRSFEYLCIPQPPDTTFARHREMRLWATWPAPTSRSHPGRRTTVSRRTSSPILLLDIDRAEMIIDDTCQLYRRPRRQVTILQVLAMRHFARLHMPTFNNTGHASTATHASAASACSRSVR